jgi:hypothetical protein
MAPLAPVGFGELAKRLLAERAARHERLASACPVAVITGKDTGLVPDWTGRSVLAAAGV